MNRPSLRARRAIARGQGLIEGEGPIDRLSEQIRCVFAYLVRSTAGHTEGTQNRRSSSPALVRIHLDTSINSLELTGTIASCPYIRHAAEYKAVYAQIKDSKQQLRPAFVDLEGNDPL